MTKKQLGQITWIIDSSWFLKESSLEAGKDILDSRSSIWKVKGKHPQEKKTSEKKTKGKIMFSHCNDYETVVEIVWNLVALTFIIFNSSYRIDQGLSPQN